VTPDGTRVVVTGDSDGSDGLSEYATVAYDSAGTQRWASRYDGPGPYFGDVVKSIGVAPDGTRVYVTGWSDDGLPQGFDFATIAYDVATGNEDWQAKYDSPGPGVDYAYSLAVSPDGSHVYVSGSGGYPYSEFLTVDYAAANGAQLSVFQYVDPSSTYDFAFASAVSPLGTMLFQTGETFVDGQDDFLTVAFTVG